MKEYCEIIEKKTTIIPETILEIGSRDGDDANFLKNFFKIKDINVWLVEPNPNQQNEIIKKYPNFNIIKNAIYNIEGVRSFNMVNKHEYVGISSLLERNDNFYKKIDSTLINVECITGFKLMEIIDQVIDLCKIDVEGATYEVLESFGDSIYNIKSFHLENEHLLVWKNQKLYDDVKDFLIKKNFTEIYFIYVNGVELQSDSIWIQKKYLKL